MHLGQDRLLVGCLAVPHAVAGRAVTIGDVAIGSVAVCSVAIGSVAIGNVTVGGVDLDIHNPSVGLG